MRGVRELFDLTGRVALVTGGGRGLGEQIARGLAQAGAAVAVGSRKREACEEVARELAGEYGARTLALRLDVSSEDEVRAAFDEIEARLGPVELLVNNSGTSWGAPAAEMTLDAWRRVMEVNVTGTFLCSRELGARLIALTRDLAVKWARYGIRVNAVAPGFFPTKMTKVVLERAEAQLARHIPLGRTGGADELMGAALFLLSPAAGYVTGQVLAVDGGLTAA